MDEFRENDGYLASFCLRVNGKNLLNKRWENAKKESIAQKIIASIMIRRAKKDHSKDKITIVPSFDIHYQELFKEFLVSENGEKRKLTAEIVNQNFEIIENFFGFKISSRKIEELNNQSMIPLEYLFNDFKKQDDQIDLTDDAGENNNIKTVLDRQNSLTSKTHMVHFIDRIKSPELEKVEGSDFFLSLDCQKIIQFIPGYITSAGIKLLYSRRQHGRSFKT